MSKFTGGLARLIPCLLLIVMVSTSCGLLPGGSGDVGADTVADDAAGDAGAVSPVLAAGAFRSLGRLAFVWEQSLYVLDGDTSRLHRLTPPGRSVHDPLWSNNGRWLAFVTEVEPGRGTGAGARGDAGGVLALSWYDGSHQHRVGGLPGPVLPGRFAWSPGADLLAVAPAGGGLWLVRPEGLPAPLIATTGTVTDLAWSPDGRALAFVEARGGERRREPAHSVLLTIETGPSATAGANGAPVDGAGKRPGARVQHIAGGPMMKIAGWWPGGGGLLFYDDPGPTPVTGGVSAPATTATTGAATAVTATAIDTAGFPLMTLALDQGAAQLLGYSLPHPEWLSWLPGENRVMTVTGPGQAAWHQKSLALCDVVTAQCEPFAPTAESVTLDVAVAPTGDRAAFVRGAAGDEATAIEAWLATRTLWFANGDGSSAVQVTTAGTGPIFAPLWSGDGRFLLYLQDNVVWLLEDGGAEAPQPLLAPWWPPEYVPGLADFGYAGWGRRLAWYRPGLNQPGEDQSGLLGPILVSPLGQRGPDGIMTASGLATLTVAAHGADRVEFYAAPVLADGLGVLFADAAPTAQGRFEAPWEAPIAGEVFRLTAVAYEGETTRRRTLLVRGSPLPAPDVPDQLFLPLRDYLRATTLPGLPKEFLAYDWLGADRIVGTAGPFLTLYDRNLGAARALGAIGYEPRPSPDQKQVAYVGPDQTIYLAGANGRGGRLLWSMDGRWQDYEGSFTAPFWSPTGRSLLAPFAAVGITEHYLIHLSPARVERLDTYVEGYYGAEAAGWADSRNIIFTASVVEPGQDRDEPGTNIFVYNSERNSYKQLTSAADGEFFVALVAHGSGVYYHRGGSGQTSTYGRLDLKGRIQWEAALGSVLALAPAPDGKSVVLLKEVGEAGSNLKLGLALYRNGDVTELAELQVADTFTGPFWSPDGQQFVLSFSSYVDSDVAGDGAGGDQDGSFLDYRTVYNTVVISVPPL